MEQGTKEWLLERKQHVTSTDAGIIMGVNPWKTPYQLWCDKMESDLEQKDNEAMRIGRELEPIARQRFIKETGIHVDPDIRFKGHLMASLDGISKDGQVIVEIKSGRKAFEQAKERVIPDYYKAQMQHQMATTGVAVVFYMAFWEDESIIMEQKKDERWIEDYLPKSKEFYRCLMDFTPPEMKEQDFITLSDSNAIQMMHELQSIHQSIKNLEKRGIEIRDCLKNTYGEKSIRTGGISLIKVLSKGRVNYNDIPELDNVNLEKYRKPSTASWRINYGK